MNRLIFSWKKWKNKNGKRWNFCEEDEMEIVSVETHALRCEWREERIGRDRRQEQGGRETNVAELVFAFIDWFWEITKRWESSSSY